MVKIGNQGLDELTDTSACGRTEFHILWCRDCVCLRADVSYAQQRK